MEEAVRLSPPMLAVTSPSTESWDEEELVRAASRGNGTAFGELYTRYARVVHGILLARVPYGDAEDLVQDVFVIAFRKIATLREPKAFSGWLGAIARHSASEFYRAGFHQTAAHSEAMRESGREKTIEPEAKALAVLQIIQTLPDAYRETLVMRFVEGLTGPEIAQRTGLTADSVRVNLHRGTKMLREKWKGPEQV
ncbi:MAG: sigma-70 family RNA polymerase sigma factor [Bryobacteraceae bacterium]